jgi:hypothetical protein
MLTYLLYSVHYRPLLLVLLLYLHAACDSMPCKNGAVLYEYELRRQCGRIRQLQLLVSTSLDWKKLLRKLVLYARSTVSLLTVVAFYVRLIDN